MAIPDLALRRRHTRAELAKEFESHAGKRGCRQVAELLQYADMQAESAMESRTRLRCIDAGVVRRLDLGWQMFYAAIECIAVQANSARGT
ncbi:hypothetical protein JGU71_15725 [Antrihabitans sp. YC3-6]|uniref:Uncharacterized protein n=1 Tax=Antrihabitans stalagmiti TaxID=2799499 RepID=A0A934NRZ5_9NOCA|nr:hypothetical protein [Antrihabitans stalagmiti]MBJ8340341.1 hypothetical protein [Antrihabitans stalagmiti]